MQFVSQRRTMQPKCAAYLMSVATITHQEPARDAIDAFVDTKRWR